MLFTKLYKLRMQEVEQGATSRKNDKIFQKIPHNFSDTTNLPAVLVKSFN